MAEWREERIGDCRLILGDCLEVLPTLGPVDAVVTDPPYGVLDEEWDKMNPQELAAFTMTWLGAIRKAASTAIIFFGEKTRGTINDLIPLVFDETRQIIWDKGGGAIAADGMFYAYESAYLCRAARISVDIVGPKSTDFGTALRQARERSGLSRGGVDIAVRGRKTGLCYRWEEGGCLPTEDQLAIITRTLAVDEGFFKALAAARQERNRNVAANLQRTKDGAAKRLDVLRYQSPTGIGHPTSKPVGLMMDLCTIADAQTILDPFMGSGTTLVACAKLGRKGIGIEIDPGYFEIACRRVEDAYRQGDMFVPRPAAPKQESLL